MFPLSPASEKPKPFILYGSNFGLSEMNGFSFLWVKRNQKCTFQPHCCEIDKGSVQLFSQCCGGLLMKEGWKTSSADHCWQCQMWFWKMLKNMFSSCPPASCSTMTTSVGSGLEQLACSIVPPLSYHNHKGQAGRIGIVGGSPEWVHIFLGVPSHEGYFNIQ